jgi:hypothetical protein
MNIFSLDSTRSISNTVGILEEGNINLDEHKAIIPHNDLRAEVIDDHIYRKFPIGISIPAIFLCFYS